jgi:isoquinoline 1-oxidoreductase alpha subunit
MSRMAISITVNGQVRSLDVDPDTPLLWAIRETVGLTGTKFGCGIGYCGACTVHVNGKAERSCGIPVSSVAGASITTIEGLAANGALNAVQQAWLTQQVPQCGYCQSGMIMAVSALLAEKPHATDADIDETITNICRCGTFARVRKAIHGLAGGDQGGA